jgi:FkbM family methyltransferase
MRVRPAQLADVLKWTLGVRRTVVRSATGHQFFADPVSNLGMHLASSGEYEPDMTRLLVAVLRPSDTFVDIGGNEGYFSVIGASLVPHGVVHCFEPQSRLFQLLQTNFDLNRAKVIIHQVAVSNKNGHVDLFLRPSTNTGASSMFRHWKVGSRAERVRCVTLDSFFREHKLRQARLMKIDCEGAEPLIVDGARDVLRNRCVEFIAMEYHYSISGTERCLAAHRQIIEAGYVLTIASGHCIYHLPGNEGTLRPLGELTLNGALPN